MVMGSTIRVRWRMNKEAEILPEDRELEEKIRRGLLKETTEIAREKGLVEKSENAPSQFPKWYEYGGKVEGYIWIDTNCPYPHESLPFGGQCRNCLARHYGFDPLVVGYPKPEYPIQTYIWDKERKRWRPSKIWK
jgi:hypothetical protein